MAQDVREQVADKSATEDGKKILQRMSEQNPNLFHVNRFKAGDRVPGVVVQLQPLSCDLPVLDKPFPQVSAPHQNRENCSARVASPERCGH